MVRATVGGYCVLTSLFLAVAVSGYAVFGAAVQVRGMGTNCLLAVLTAAGEGCRSNRV